jgi:hypothetical protein
MMRDAGQVGGVFLVPEDQDRVRRRDSLAWMGMAPLTPWTLWRSGGSDRCLTRCCVCRANGAKIRAKGLSTIRCFVLGERGNDTRSNPVTSRRKRSAGNDAVLAPGHLGSGGSRLILCKKRGGRACSWCHRCLPRPKESPNVYLLKTAEQGPFHSFRSRSLLTLWILECKQYLFCLRPLGISLFTASSSLFTAPA